MKVHELQVTATPDKRRRGRGIAAGLGKTAGRGTKGQNSRTGGGVKIGFEGGQTKFSMRMPKNRGFTAKNRTEYQVVSTDQLEQLKKTTITKEDLVTANLVSKNQKAKLLFAGSVEKKYTITVDAASKSAIEAIEKAGGSVVVSNIRTPKLSKEAKVKARASAREAAKK